MPEKKRKPQQLAWDSTGMSPLAQVQFEKYKRWLKEDMSAIQATPLVVLVWGPGRSGGDLFKKRLQIRDMLRQHGDVALFSEELDEVCKGYAASARGKELVQANRADFIVVIYGSPGSIAEVHDFGGFLDVLGSKMLVCIDSRYSDGYGYSGLLTELESRFKNVHKYTYPADIHECHLMSAVDERLKKLRLGKWWAVRLGRA